VYTASLFVDSQHCQSTVAYFMTVNG